MVGFLYSFFPGFSSPVYLGQRVTKDPRVLASQKMSPWHFSGFFKPSSFRSDVFKLRLGGSYGLQLRNYMHCKSVSSLFSGGTFKLLVRNRDIEIREIDRDRDR